MTGEGPGLTPELAVDYLRELSTDIRAAVVLTPDGEPARGARHAVVAVCGRYALPALIRYDLKVVLGELAAEPGGGEPATRTEAA
jgi:hypothetical protein